MWVTLFGAKSKSVTTSQFSGYIPCLQSFEALSRRYVPTEKANYTQYDVPYC